MQVRISVSTLNCSLRHGTELLNRKNKRDMNIANAKLGRSHTQVSLTFAYLLDKHDILGVKKAGG